jgi:shikimate kinase
MCTGKSTVGRALAKTLGIEYRFVETDEIIEDLANKSIPDIFSEEGELKFREYEIEACKQVSTYNKVVISCGGGVVLNMINIDYLKRNSSIVLLETMPEIIYERAMKDGKETRPVINKENVREEINKKLQFREPFYKAAADVVINTSNKPIKLIVNEIISKTNLRDFIKKLD